MFPHFLFWNNWKRCNSITHSSNQIFQFTEFNKMDDVVLVPENPYLITCLPGKKMVCHFNLNIFIFLPNLPHFSRHDINSLFLILLSFLQWNLYTPNQDIYRHKWLTILESQFIDKEGFLGLKTLLFCHWILWVLLCVVISQVNGRKYENLPQFNTDCLAFLRTWHYFRLGFSFGCSGYHLTVIKKSHILNCCSLLQKF